MPSLFLTAPSPAARSLRSSPFGISYCQFATPDSSRRTTILPRIWILLLLTVPRPCSITCDVGRPARRNWHSGWNLFATEDPIVLFINVTGGESVGLNIDCVLDACKYAAVATAKLLLCCCKTHCGCSCQDSLLQCCCCYILAARPLPSAAAQNGARLCCCPCCCCCLLLTAAARALLSVAPGDDTCDKKLHDLSSLGIHTLLQLLLLLPDRF